MTKLAFVSLCLIGISGSALAAQMTMSLDSSAPPASPTLTLSTDDSSSMSHMSTPPEIAPSSDEAVPNDDETDEPDDAPSGPPVASADALKLFVTTCTAIAGAKPGAVADAKTAGWVADEPTDTGPFVTIYSGYNDVSGYGSVDLWSSLETFPTQRLGYCRVDFADSDSRIDFHDIDALGLTGSVQDAGGGNIYGSWESADHTILLTAGRTDGQAQLEFNVLTSLSAPN